MDETYLYHYGILGQKWGIRRFQNEDGTRTLAGKQRYSKSGSSETKRKVNTETLKTAGKIIAAGATVAAAAYVYKNNKAVINTAAKIAISRLDNRYGDMDKFKYTVDKGKKYIKDLDKDPVTSALKKGATKVVLGAVEGAGVIAGTKAMYKVLGEDKTKELLDATNAYRKKDDKLKYEKVDTAAKKKLINVKRG